jgi:hypothetical protein
MKIVFSLKKSVDSFIEIPKADLLPFRAACLFILADKNHVFVRNTDSPISEISISSFRDINWKSEIIEGVDGKTFEPCRYKYETTYWKDKFSVYYVKKTGNMAVIKLVEAERESFEELGFGFGRDKDHVFFLDKVIPINAKCFNLNKHGFMYDDKNIFHYQHQIPLDVRTFKVVEYECETNPFMGTFILENRSGKYEYNRDWKGEQMKLITKY